MYLFAGNRKKLRVQIYKLFAALFVLLLAIGSANHARAIDFLTFENIDDGVMLLEGAASQNDLVYVGTTVDDKVIKGAQNFVQNMGERALGFLSNSSYSTERKTKEFKKLLADSFDMKTIGRFAMGRYWRTATDSQKKEYLKLFEEMVVEVYAGRFDEYSGESFRVGNARAEGKRDAIVTSYITSDNGPDVQVDWRVRYKNSKYQIVDVIVEGVSMSVTQRSEFSTLIQRGGGDVSVLLSHLKERK